jgi:hypothetical protein
MIHAILETVRSESSHVDYFLRSRWHVRSRIPCCVATHIVDVALLCEDYPRIGIPPSVVATERGNAGCGRDERRSCCRRSEGP